MAAWAAGNPRATLGNAELEGYFVKRVAGLEAAGTAVAGSHRRRPGRRSRRSAGSKLAGNARAWVQNRDRTASANRSSPALLERDGVRGGEAPFSIPPRPPRSRGTSIFRSRRHRASFPRSFTSAATPRWWKTASVTETRPPTIITVSLVRPQRLRRPEPPRRSNWREIAGTHHGTYSEGGQWWNARGHDSSRGRGLERTRWSITSLPASGGRSGPPA